MKRAVKTLIGLHATIKVCGYPSILPTLEPHWNKSIYSARRYVKGRTNFIPRIVNEEEMMHIIHVAEQETLIWSAMVLKILWCTGIRVGEVASLKVGDIRKQQHTLY